jgi:hypothetical protein
MRITAGIIYEKVWFVNSEPTPFHGFAKVLFSRVFHIPTPELDALPTRCYAANIDIASCTRYTTRCTHHPSGEDRQSWQLLKHI